MAAELPAELDSLTGVPLLIAPDLDALQERSEQATWHHLYHPSTSPLLTETLGGKALRSSRVQLLPPEQHNYGTHNYHTIFKGPVIPTDPGAQFAACVFSSAGYIPRQVVDISRRDASVVRNMTDAELGYFRMTPASPAVTERDIRLMTDKMKVIAHDRGENFSLTEAEIVSMISRRNRQQAALSVNGLRYAYQPMRDFFLEYLRKPEMLDVTPRFAKSFLRARGQDKIARGERLLERVSVVAGSQFLATYRHAHDKGLLNARMQSVPFELVRDKLGNAVQRASILPLFAERLEEVLNNQPANLVA